MLFVIFIIPREKKKNVKNCKDKEEAEGNVIPRGSINIIHKYIHTYIHTYTERNLQHEHSSDTYVYFLNFP